MDASWRITPAGAGKTGRVFPPCAYPADHPRRCGENDGVPANFDDEAGSPPQVRGKPAVVSPKKIARRITPAGAGKTFIVSVAGHAEEDHPRRCGENRFVDFAFKPPQGSPPQVRGKLICVMPCSTVDRITPAGAGKTTVNNLRQRVNEDHPRRCGENSAKARVTRN